MTTISTETAHASDCTFYDDCAIALELESRMTAGVRSSIMMLR
jgi:hypothetical protein